MFEISKSEGVTNHSLAFVVPTFNRADILDRCLDRLIIQAKPHNIPIYVCDNASTDHTKDVVDRKKIAYPSIFYNRNSSNLGMDRNFEISLKSPTAEYVWMVGDTYVLPNDGVDRILETIYSKNVECDLIVLNLERRVNDTPSREYTNANSLLSQLGWHMTCISCLVFKRNIIESGSFARYYGTDLVHVGVIFEFLSSRQFKVAWLAEVSVSTDSEKVMVGNSWYARVFEIWTILWPTLIYSLPPSYKLSEKRKCVYDHNRKSGLMTFVGLLNLRSKNHLNYNIYTLYAQYFSMSLRLPSSIIFLISVCPRFPILCARRMYMAIRGRVRKCIDLKMLW